MSQLLLPAAVCSLQWQRRRKLLSELSGFNFVPGFPQTIYQEFYCDASGAGSASNLNGGSDTTGPITDLAGTYKRGLGAGGTDQILASSGTPFANVVPGSYVGIKAASGTGVLDYCAAVLAVNGGGTDIFVADGTVSTRSFGTRPADAASIDSRVGGRWLGPNGAVGFPFGSITATCTDVSGNPYCVNYINTSTYAITAAMAHSLAGPGMHAGYATTVRDGGRAVFDGGTAGASYTLLTYSSSGVLDSLAIQNNGASGSTVALVLSSSAIFGNRLIVNSVRGRAITCSGEGSLLRECEVYGYNQSNTAATNGIVMGTRNAIWRCDVHNDLQTSGTQGFGISLSSTSDFAFGCRAYNLFGHGFELGASGANLVQCCDAFGCGGDGARISNAAAALAVIENTNFVGNVGYGIRTNLAGSGRFFGILQNCGFGTGAYANGAGDVSAAKSMIISNCFKYAPPGHPYANPATGDFRIVHHQALGAGRGLFTQTGNSKSGSVAYPDVGSCQSRRPPRRVFPGGVGA